MNILIVRLIGEDQLVLNKGFSFEEERCYRNTLLLNGRLCDDGCIVVSLSLIYIHT